MVTITPLDAVLGAAVEGVDLSAAPSDELMRELTAALYAHRVIVIKHQKLDQESYLHFGRQWGEPIPHVANHMRLPGYPELMGVGNTEQKDRADSVRLGAGGPSTITADGRSRTTVQKPLALPRAGVYHVVGVPTPERSRHLTLSRRCKMPVIAKSLVLLAVITFVLAVLGAWTGNMMGIGAEALSRACTNLALIAIAIVVVFKEEGATG